MEDFEKDSEVNNQEKKEQPPANSTKRLVNIMIVVLIICGGNGFGIILAAVLWKYTGMVLASIALMIVITAIFFITAMLILRRLNVKKD